MLVFILFPTIIGLAALGLITERKIKSALKESAYNEIGQVSKLLKLSTEMFYKQTLDLVWANFKNFRSSVYGKGVFTLDKDSLISIKAVNQTTNQGGQIDIPIMQYAGEKVADNFPLVDNAVKDANIEGLTTTIFQKIPDGLLRITTNVMKTDNTRAVGTFIPSSSAVYKKIMAGETFRGRAFVVNQWYWTVYEPIKENGEIIGVLYMGIKEQVLIQVLKDIYKKVLIDQTGYPLLIDDKGTMLIHPTLENKNVMNVTDGKGTKITQEFQKRKDGWLEYYFKKPGANKESKKIVRFATIKGLNWIVAIGPYEDEIYADQKAISRIILIITLALLLILTIIVFFVVTNMANRTKNIRDILKDISDGEGDLTKTLPVTTVDEQGQLAEYVNSFIGNLRNLIADAKTNSSNVSKSNSSLVNTVSHLSETFEHQSDELINVSAGLEQIVGSVEIVNNSISSSQQRTSDTKDVTMNGQQQLEKSVHVMEQVKKEVRELMVTINKLADSSDEIGSILSVINDIADQTNLLALNAAIEAARAGDAGRGFAVVADEVRKLAEKTQTSTQEIGAIISELQNETKAADQKMNVASKFVEEGVDMITLSGENFNIIVESVTEIDSSSNMIAEAVNEQNSSVLNINNKISSISSGVEESVSSISDLSQSIADVANQAETLEKMLNKFKT